MTTATAARSSTYDGPADGAAPPQPQQEYFRITDRVPAQVWYWAAMGSILASATLFLAGKRDWSLFVGQWPPTFLLLALVHKLLRPGG
jgi:hypothetical protein